MSNMQQDVDDSIFNINTAKELEKRAKAHRKFAKKINLRLGPGLYLHSDRAHALKISRNATLSSVLEVEEETPIPMVHASRSQ